MTDNLTGAPRRPLGGDDGVLVSALLAQMRDDARRRYGLHLAHALVALVLLAVALTGWWPSLLVVAPGWFLGIHAAEAWSARRDLHNVPKWRPYRPHKNEEPAS